MKTAISAIVTLIFIFLFVSCGSVNDLANQYNQRASSDKSINILSPITDDFVADIVNVQAALAGVTLNDLKKVELLIGGSLKATYSLPPFNYTWDTSSLSDGPVDIKFIATLKDNSTVEKAVTVTVRKGIFVSATGSELNPGTKALPMLNIQDAVNKAVSLGISMIYVAQGTYTPGHGLNLSGSGILITNDNIHLVGGYLSDFSAKTSALSDLNGNNTLYHVIDCQWIRNLTIDGFIVRGGNATSSGWNNSAGGMMVYGITNLLVTNVIVMNNNATYVGGIEVYEGSNCVLDMIISNNFNANSCGGAMFIVINDLTFHGKVVNNNTSSGYNGGFYIGNCTNVTITADVKNNYCASYGGGLYIDVSSNVNLNDCIVNDNTAGNHGGGVYLSTSVDISISNCIFLRNYCGSYGGGLYLTSISQSSIRQCLIDSNTSAAAGGGISIVNSASITINDTDICSNLSLTGGAMYSFGTTYNMSNNNILSNKATSTAGGIWIQQCTVTITNCQINNNTSAAHAGGMFLITANVNLVGSSVSSNIGGSYGGGIDSDNGSILNISNSSISYNTSTGSTFGGGIYFNNTQSTIRNSVINGNKIPSGGAGAIMIYSTTIIELNGCDISGNSAYNVGAIYWFINNYSLSIIGCTLTNDLGANPPLNDVIALQPNGSQTNLLISNNTFSGTNNSSTCAIHEYAGALNGQYLVNNIFITNQLGNLYYDSSYGYITNTELWTNINAVLYTGAAIATNNTVAAQ